MSENDMIAEAMARVEDDRMARFHRFAPMSAKHYEETRAKVADLCINMQRSLVATDPNEAAKYAHAVRGQIMSVIADWTYARAAFARFLETDVVSLSFAIERKAKRGAKR